MSRLNHRRAAAFVALASCLLWGSAAIADPVRVEFEDWSTPFAPNNPIQCTGPSCSVTTGPTVIGPLVTPVVKRTATLESTSGSASSGQAAAEIFGSGCAVDPTEGCLQFTTNDKMFASLTLDYNFSQAQTLGNIGLKVMNLTSGKEFGVAVFYDDDPLDPLHWHYAAGHRIDSGDVETYVFDLGGHTTTDVRVVYNPLSQGTGDGAITDWDTTFAGGPQDSLHVELCCVMTNVPEPASVPLVAMAVGALALTRRWRKPGEGSPTVNSGD